MKGCLDCLYDKCPSKYINLKVQGVELWEGRKEGWKEEEREGSVIDKSEPKRGSHSPPKLEAGQKIIHFLRHGARRVKHQEVELTILQNTHDGKHAMTIQATSSN